MWEDCPIEIGSTYSYKTLCKLLDNKEKTGGAKVNQVEHWQTCFKWEWAGKKFKITKIIKELDHRPHMQRENSKWYKSAAIILINKIINSLGNGGDSECYNEVALNSIEAYMALGLCNGKFKYLKSENFENIPLELRMKFHAEASDKFYHILKNLLNSLESQSIITVTRVHRFATENQGGKTKLATYSEEAVIRGIKGKLLKKYKLQTEYDVRRFCKEAAFYKELTPLLDEKGFYNCYKVYLIKFTNEYLPKYRQYLGSLELQASAQIDINTKSYTDLIAKANSNADDYTTNSNARSNFRKLIDLTIPITN